RAAHARSRRGAVPPRVLCRLVDVIKAGQANATVAVVADINEPPFSDVSLHIQTPLLRVGVLVIDRDTALNTSRSAGDAGRGYGRATGQIRRRNVRERKRNVVTQAVEDVVLGVTEDDPLVEEHAEPGADRGLAVSPRVPGEAHSGRKSGVVLLTDL